MSEKLTRRTLLTQSAVAVGAGIAGTATQAAVPSGRDPFEYEITRTDEEWHELLGDDYPILRLGETETQFTHPLWQEKRAGTYHCKGCDLHIYSSEQKYFPEKGWVFFTVSQPNTQMTSIDAASDMIDTMVSDDREHDELNGVAAQFFIENHCRRCGSHHGHILPVAGRALHCINGAALVFKPEEAA